MFSVSTPVKVVSSDEFITWGSACNVFAREESIFGFCILNVCNLLLVLCVCVVLFAKAKVDFTMEIPSKEDPHHLRKRRCLYTDLSVLQVRLDCFRDTCAGV